MSKQDTQLIQHPIQWMEATEVADYLGLSHRQFSEKHCMRTDFPSAYRLSPRGRRRWRKTEIDAYLESKREKAA
jgi:predicted DNA-binding transcriptional regulator AlpA